MALLFIDGFETYGTSDSAPTVGSIVDWQVIPTTATGVYIREGRNATGLSIGLSYHEYLIKKLNTTNDTLIVGFAMYTETLGADDWEFCILKSSQTAGINLHTGTDGSIKIKCGSTLLDTSDTGVITANTWQYVEIKVKCNDTTGTYDVWVDDVNVLSGSNVDTKAGTLAYHDVVWLTRGDLAYENRFDDFYVLDGSATTPNTRLTSSNTFITAIYPNGDSVIDWTPTGGGSHYTQVNTYNESTYIETGTSGDQDIFDYEAFSKVGTTIEAIQINTVAMEKDAKSYPLKTVAASSSNTVFSSNKPVCSTDPLGFTHVMVTDPDGDAWTKTALDSAKFGVEVG